MRKNKKITVVFTSNTKEKPQTSAEEIAAKLVKNTQYKLKNSVY
jgi:hypothetical protein